MKKTKQKMLKQKLMGVMLIALGILPFIIIQHEFDCGGCFFPIGLGLILLTSKDIVIN